MYNTASNFSGVKDWELKIGDTMNGPWADLANGTLPDPRLTRWNVPLAIKSISGYDIPAGQVGEYSQLSHAEKT